MKLKGPIGSMVVFRWGGHSVWMTHEQAVSFIERDRKRRKPEKRAVAYVVRCRLKPAPSA